MLLISIIMSNLAGLGLALQPTGKVTVRALEIHGTKMHLDATYKGTCR